MLKKGGAGSSGGMVSVKEPNKLPIPAIAGSAVAALCIIAYFVFGGSSKEAKVASASATASVEKSPSETSVRKAAPEAPAPKPLVPVAGPVPIDPAAASPRRELSEEARPLPEPPAKAPEISRRQTADSTPAPEEAPKAENLKKEAGLPAAVPDAAGKDAAKPAGADASVASLLEKKDEKSATPTPDAPDAPAAPAVPPSAPLPLPLNDDTPDDPFNRDQSLARKVAPPAVAKGGNEPAAGKPAMALAKPRAAFVRGKSCDLFPADLSSHTDEIADPRNAGKTAKIDRFDGWIFTCPELVGMSVKDGVLNMTKQGMLQLDRFPCTEYKLSFEVQLGGNSALAVVTDASVAVSNLLIITDTHFMPGTWDTAQTANNVKGEDKLAKPHGGAKDGWITVQLGVHTDSIDCQLGSKPAVKLAMPKNGSLAQLGFMSMGLKGNATPSFKVRKATLYAP
jgi:hypothetical protein